jgi:hypothetical protein
MPAQWNIASLRARGTRRRWAPQTGIEAVLGDPYASDPGVSDQLEVPLDPGINLLGWINPYSLTMYQALLSTTSAVQVAPPNLRRCYLILQNQGPGNAFVNFGQAAVAPTATLAANCLQLIQTQFYEEIGGGGFDFDRQMSMPNAFVSPDYVSAITDTATTTLLIAEGVWVNRQYTAAPA